MTDQTATDLTGKFLIALPSMGDPRFSQAVIYICSHDDKGAMGLVINKSRGNDLAEILDSAGIENTQSLAERPILDGGPVDIDRGFVLHTPDYAGEDTGLKLTDTLTLTATPDILEALPTDKAPSKAVLAVGYSGWGGGQLEQELQANAWITVDADEDLIFDTDMDRKWERALAQLGISPEMLSHRGGTA